MEVQRAEYEKRMREPAVELATAGFDEDSLRYRRVHLRGEYDAEGQFLMDNQIHQRTGGFHVLTPLRTPSGAVVLVDRGWIYFGGDRRELPPVPTPSGQVDVEGFINQPPAGGQGGSADGPVRTRVDWAVLGQRYPALIPLVVYLAPDSAAGGFLREWGVSADKIPKHRGYALQWYAFATMLVLAWGILGWRKDRTGALEQA